jgi:hypothetical protein
VTARDAALLPQEMRTPGSDAGRFSLGDLNAGKFAERWRLPAAERPRTDSFSLPGLERFQAKWKPVRVKKTRQNKKREPRL